MNKLLNLHQETPDDLGGCHILFPQIIQTFNLPELMQLTVTHWKRHASLTKKEGPFWNALESQILFGWSEKVSHPRKNGGLTCFFLLAGSTSRLKKLANSRNNKTFGPKLCSFLLNLGSERRSKSKFNQNTAPGMFLLKVPKFGGL